MQTLVEGAVAEALRDSGGEVSRLYVAACAERMAPLFICMRAGVPGREADLDLCVRSVRDLWHTGRPLADSAERASVLERFPELQPGDEGITEVADTYASFGALVLRTPCWPAALGMLMTRWPADTRRSPRWECWTRTSRVPASVPRNRTRPPPPLAATPAREHGPN
ncbi:hypothetical protein ACFYN0_17160 [Streptomyces sp. NPDC006704]|uniref:hypothetical protein n=1 Tax=Streptomyces sp. NPDC006704 TaxID=3364760 RepID=UPI0036C6F7D0